jgi:hypothetical protein
LPRRKKSKDSSKRILMRLTFPNAEQQDMVTDAGIISLGANAENTIVLAGDGVRPLHAYIFVDARGIVLNVTPPARVHVNARPVREKALLRLGDVLSIDTLQILLKPDRDSDIRTQLIEIKSPQKRALPRAKPTADAPRCTPSRVVLRGISGSHFGRIVALRGLLTIGSGVHCDLRLDEPQMPREHAAIECIDDVIQLRDLGSTQTTRVNGVAVRDAVLHSGDQIAFERNRFVIEAPGLPQRQISGAEPEAPVDQLTQSWRLPVIPEAAPAPVKPAPRQSATRFRHAAALIGIAIAAALLIKF